MCIQRLFHSWSAHSARACLGFFSLLDIAWSGWDLLGRLLPQSPLGRAEPLWLSFSWSCASLIRSLANCLAHSRSVGGLADGSALFLRRAARCFLICNQIWSWASVGRIVCGFGARWLGAECLPLQDCRWSPLIPAWLILDHFQRPHDTGLHRLSIPGTPCLRSVHHAGRTAAEYIRLAFLIDGPQVEVAILVSDSMAAVPLAICFLICSFQSILGSTQTPRILNLDSGPISLPSGHAFSLWNE